MYLNCLNEEYIKNLKNYCMASLRLVAGPTKSGQCQSFMQNPAGTTDVLLLDIHSEKVSTSCSARDAGSSRNVSMYIFTILTS